MTLLSDSIELRSHGMISRIEDLDPRFRNPTLQADRERQTALGTARESVSRIEESIKKYPMLVLATAVAAGVIIGWLIKRR
jgi:hypothetical protein